VNLCRQIALNAAFQRFILFLILMTSANMGLETIPEFTGSFGAFFIYFENFAQIVFIFEIVIRIVAYAPSVSVFFRSFWNVFDFVIVGASLLPGTGALPLVARLLRIIRVLRVFSASARMRRFMERLDDAFDEIAHTAIIVAILCYIFSIAGFYLFANIDSAHWGTLARSFVSTFYLLLFQDIPEFIEPIIKISKMSILFFLSFYFVFIALFMSVVSAAVTQSLESKK